MKVKRVSEKMYVKMISVIQCQNPTSYIALRLSADAFSYSRIRFLRTDMNGESFKISRRGGGGGGCCCCCFVVVFFAFLLQLMCVYFLLFKNIFIDPRKEKKAV